MSEPNFADLLKQPADSFKKPPCLPSGTYHGMVAKHEFGKSRDKQTPFVRFHLQLLAAGDAIDPELLTGIDIAKRSQWRDYYITPDSLWRLTTFLKSIGISTEGRSLNETIPEAQGQRVLVHLTQKPNAAGTDFYNEVTDVIGDSQ